MKQLMNTNCLPQVTELNPGQNTEGKSITELLKEAHKEAEELKEQYQKRYRVNDLTNIPVNEIRRAEIELQECQNCTGEPCIKKHGCQYMFPVIRNINGKLSVAHARCKIGELLILKNSYKRCHIPFKYAEKSFDDYQITEDNRDAVKKSRWYITEKPKKGLYLFGGAGTGKTFLASLIAKEFILDFKKVIFGDYPNLLGELKATFDKGGTEDLLKRYCDCDLLILDDLGTEQATDWSAGVLYRLINARYNDDKTIVVTSNYDLKGLGKRLTTNRDDFTATRIISRLKEMTYQAFLGTHDRREGK